MCSSTAGGRQASFLGALTLSLRRLPAREPEAGVEREDAGGEPLEALDRPVKASENKELNVLEVGDGGLGSSSESSSLSRVKVSLSDEVSASEEGKKLRKSPSACHLDAFLNSIQTSMRPGRHSAGSRRSKWFVVLGGHVGQYSIRT